jgi:hypothetical protein
MKLKDSLKMLSVLGHFQLFLQTSIVIVKLDLVKVGFSD